LQASAQTTLKETDNVTIYTFMYNILSDDSFVKSKNIWCSPDRSKAWDDWMIGGPARCVAAESCASPNEEVLALGRKLGISARRRSSLPTARAFLARSTPRPWKKS
jgi:thiol:disulfide interchange protein DsbC